MDKVNLVLVYRLILADEICTEIEVFDSIHKLSKRVKYLKSVKCLFDLKSFILKSSNLEDFKNFKYIGLDSKLKITDGGLYAKILQLL